jgi:hypothetical protein
MWTVRRLIAHRLRNEAAKMAAGVTHGPLAALDRTPDGPLTLE